MRVVIYAADATGCGHYRLVWPGQVAKAAGVDVLISPLKGGIPMKTSGGRVISVAKPNGADVVVFQRMTGQLLHQVVRLYRSAGIAVVVDMDDDLSRIHPANPAFEALRPGNPNGQSWEYAQQACDDATLVTVSTPALLSRYARHGRGRVLYNCVPAQNLTLVSQHQDSDVIGWGGSTHSHPDDLQVLGNAMVQLGTKFQVVGPPDGVAEALRLTGERLEATGAIAMRIWPAVLSASLGVGIAPLADSKFNLSKSWLKPLEYASVGVPCVMSPRPEYRRIYKEGIGLLADRPRDWLRRLQALQASSHMRQDLAGKGAEAAARWTIQGNIHRWIETWEEALRIQRGVRPSATVVA